MQRILLSLINSPALKDAINENKKKKIMCNPTTGSPTITLFQLHSNCRVGLDPQIKKSLAESLKQLKKIIFFFKLIKKKGFFFYFSFLFVKFPNNKTLRA